MAEGFYCVGFDIEQHVYGEHRYPAQLVIQDVLTLHGSQFKDAALIVASPPCQEYSYMAMQWTRAKQRAAEYRSGVRDVADLNRLFEACFRIQREACAAAGRHVPMVVENVRGAQPWVGRSRWNYGSFHLWGDVPALMPMTKIIAKRPGHDWNRFKETGEVAPHWRLNGDDSLVVNPAIKNSGGSWFNIAHNTISGHGQNPDGRKTARHPNQRDGHRSTAHLTNPAEHNPAIKNAGGSWFGDGNGALVCRADPRDNPKTAHVKQGGDWFQEESGISSHNFKSSKRKMASALIAKIPEPVSRHIARTFRQNIA